MDFSKKSCLLVDHGLNLWLALRLAQDFGKVRYWTPWATAFPDIKGAAIGSGFNEIERVEDLDDYLDDTELIICPDNYFGSWANEQRRLGRRVWGAGDSEKLELDRWLIRNLQSHRGMPTPGTEQITGMEALERYCAKHPETFIKLSRYRGLRETFKAANFETLKIDLLNGLGPFREEFKFLAEEKIDGVEIGCDTWVINGEYPSRVLAGIEVKDCGYVGRVFDYPDLWETVRDCNAGVAPAFKKLGGATFYSNELRVAEDDRKGYLIDMTVRMPIPPGPCYGKLWSNLSEIIYAGAEGRLVVPEPTAKYAVLARIHCPYAAKHWVKVDVEKEAWPYVAFSNAVKVNDELWIAPQPHESIEIGDVIATGESLKECEATIKEVSKMISGHDVDIQEAAVKQAEDAFEKAAELGIEF